MRGRWTLTSPLLLIVALGVVALPLTVVAGLVVGIGVLAGAVVGTRRRRRRRDGP